MDRIINVKVCGNYLSKDNKNAGVRGEANVTKLRITFDEGWEGYTKKVTFWDARGLNPVVIDLLPHLCEGGSTYIVPIPAEPMTEAGQLTFVIDGTVGDKVQRSLSDKLEVKDAPVATNAGQPVPPTQDELTQVQGEIEAIKGDIERTLNYAASLQSSEANAHGYSEAAASSAIEAEIAALNAKAAIDKYPFIGSDNYWWAWNVGLAIFENTNVKAQAGSTVYMGDNPPAEADVWINPEGDTDNYATKAFVEARLLELANKVAPSPASVTLYADRWEQSENEQRWHQEVVVANATITEYSKVDLQLSAEQIMIFYEKDLAFVAENDDGKVTVYCIGRVPENDYIIQATVSEVVVDG